MAEMPAAPQQSGGRRSTESRGTVGNGSCHHWPTVIHHGTAALGFRKLRACTAAQIRRGGRTDPAMEAPDPPDPPVWASAIKEDRAGKPRSTSVPAPAREWDGEQERERTLTCAAAGQQASSSQLARGRGRRQRRRLAGPVPAPALAGRAVDTRPCRGPDPRSPAAGTGGHGGGRQRGPCPRWPGGQPGRRRPGVRATGARDGAASGESEARRREGRYFSPRQPGPYRCRKGIGHRPMFV